MLFSFLGISLIAFSVFSMMGGTPVPLGLTLLLGALALVIAGTLRAGRQA